MVDIRKEFSYRRKIALEANASEVSLRLVGLLDWMEGVRVIRQIVERLKKEGHGPEELSDSLDRNKYNPIYKIPPQTRDLEDIASLGWAIVLRSRECGDSIGEIAREAGIKSPYKSNQSAEESVSNAVLARYINPFLDYVEHRLPETPSKATSKAFQQQPPPTIHDSLKRFQSCHRDGEMTCFIMMRFGKTAQHSKIEKTIKATLKKHGITGLLARDKEFHDDLFPNILTYLHGCAFGIAVFERIESDEFNPNVALEVGYMLGLRKQVLLLKDHTLRALHTDLVGKLYREFDSHQPQLAIPQQIEGWLSDKGLA